MKQGDPPSPFFFNIYMNDPCSDLLNSNNIDTPKISDLAVPCLFWADDLVLISEAKEGLRQHLNVLEKYCKDWKLNVNTDKTQVIIFNKNGKLIKKEKIFYRQQGIDSVKGYKYLEIWLDCNGKFNRAMNELAKKGMKATHSIYILSTCNYISTEVLLKTYESIIKPIIMFSSEVWGHQMKSNNDNELSFVKFCKHILGVNRRSINKVVMSELGVYPFFIDAKLNIISFYLYLKGSKNILLSESLNEMEILNSEWYKCANKLISDHITNLDQYKYCNKKQKGEKDGKISHETLKKQLRLKLQQQYVSEWKTEIGSSSKLNFYGEIKEKYTFEKYLDFIDNRQHKAALTKLRISAHRLYIETGRYKRYDYNLGRYVNTPREEETCSVCVNEIEDEYHFLFECKKNKEWRKEFYRKITLIKENLISMNNSEKVQFLFSLSETEKGTI